MKEVFTNELLTFSEENVDKTKTIGKFGEKIAEKYLLENKYKILEKNYLCKYGEIDIIAKYKKDLVLKFFAFFILCPLFLIMYTL